MKFGITNGVIGKLRLLIAKLRNLRTSNRAVVTTIIVQRGCRKVVSDQNITWLRSHPGYVPIVVAEDYPVESPGISPFDKVIICFFAVLMLTVAIFGSVWDRIAKLRHQNVS